MATRCEFDLTACAECACFGDCLDEQLPDLRLDAPRDDAPLKVIKPWCRIRRDRRRWAHERA